MLFDFDTQMQQATDAELVHAAVTNRDDYQPEAVAAAEAELNRRQLPDDQFNHLKNRQIHKNHEEAYRAEIPLETGWKIFSFLFPGILQLLVAGSFKAGGYDRKANELGTWTLYGFFFYIGLTVFFAMT